MSGIFNRYVLKRLIREVVEDTKPNVRLIPRGGRFDQYLKEPLSLRESRPDRGFLSEEEKQDSIQIEGPGPEVPTISNQAPEGSICTMMVVKFSYVIKGPRVKVYGLLCGGL